MSGSYPRTRQSRAAVSISSRGAFERLSAEVGPVAGEVVEDLVEDLVGPFGLDEAGLGDADEQVAQGARVEDVGVVDDDEGYRSGHPHVLGERGQFDRCLAAPLIVVAQVVQERGGLDSSVLADLIRHRLPQRRPARTQLLA
jgi:hypothetical protein